jgi:ABC-2 type transport system ATP-binding protein
MPMDVSPAETGSIALDVDRVFKRFTRTSFFGLKSAKGIETQALQDISLEVCQGETVGLLGPNGSGKTTLLKIIATLLEPTSGTVKLYGTDIAREARKVRGRIGLVTCDERSFYWRLSGRENLNFFGALYGLSAAHTARRSEMLVEMLGLAHAFDRSFQSYSSGMKQKLAIARGLLSEPELVLHDEPTRSLDPLSAYHIRQWLAQNRKQCPKQTHLIATNQLQEAEQLCDRVLIINRGVILAAGTVQEIRDRWNKSGREAYEVAFEGHVDLRALDPIFGSDIFAVTERPHSPGQFIARFDSSEADGRLSSVLRVIVQAGGSVLYCKSQQASFDEIFCSMVEQQVPAVGASK